ncbi:MAG: hypothetical protein AAF488_20170, partial [Planctomycetota bacterium]
SRRRVGAEGERVKIGTLHFDIAEEVGDVSEVELRFGNTPRFGNSVTIRHGLGAHAGELPIETEVSPIVLSNGFLLIQSQPTVLGDVNFDYRRDVSDPVDLLGMLFRGTGPVNCPQASDVNQDGRVDVSDPINLLHHLFFGGQAPPEVAVTCSAID